MNLSIIGKRLIEHYERCRLEAYQDSVGIWTIGWGATHYEDGTPVKEGDTITQEKADELFNYLVSGTVAKLNYLLSGVNLKQNQFDALVSLAYNIGNSAFEKSTLLNLVYSNPTNPAIPDEFEKWCHAGGKIVKGLLYRRQTEAKLYETGN